MSDERKFDEGLEGFIQELKQIGKALLFVGIGVLAGWLIWRCG